MQWLQDVGHYSRA
jgi:hypothetical protein